jgi:hypothetical protein
MKRHQLGRLLKTAGSTLFAALLLGTVVPATSSAATQPAAVPPLPLLAVDAYDYGFTLSQHQIAAGTVTLALHDSGKVDHEALLFRLKDGVTEQQYVDALNGPGGLGAANALVTYAGGANVVQPGKSQVTVQTLVPGNYLVVSYAQDEAAVPEVYKGMHTALTVVDRGTAPQPVPDSLLKGTFSAADMSFTVPPVIHGAGLFKFTNADPKLPHELGLVRLKPGATRDSVIAWAQTQLGEPPFFDAGGFGALPAGGTGWLVVDLPVGSYAAICLVHSPFPPYESHAAMGQVVTFTVS